MSVRERVLEHLKKALNYTLKALKELEDTRRLCLSHGFNVYNNDGYSLRDGLKWRISDAASLAEDILFAMKAIKAAREPKPGAR